VKLHRTSKGVWGTCTFHEPTGRSPNRASTVRAHNWVVLGSLLPGQPWTYLPHAARLYFRKSQLPERETFRPKTQWAVDLFRQADAESEAPLLAVFDGAYATRTVIQPCLNPAPGGRRIEVVTRLREDARLFRPLVAQARAKGRPRKWGRRMAAPKHHEKWDVPWQEGEAYIYGRVRTFQFKQVRCYWSVSGPSVPVDVYVFQVEGYEEPWFLVSTALDLTPAQVVAVFAARFRQEDGFRDHKQRLGMEECRAWTKEPVLRTFAVQLVALTLMRLVRYRLDAAWGAGSWWSKPEWYRHKQHPSILDVRRLFWRYRQEFSQFLQELEDIEKVEEEPAPRRARAG